MVVVVLDELPVEPLSVVLAPLVDELPPLDVLLDELVLLELDRESSSVEDDSGESRNTTERRSVSIRRNKARATCERSISTWPNADDDQCICKAVYNATSSKLDNPSANTISNSVKPCFARERVDEWSGFSPIALTLSQIRSDEVAARRKRSGEPLPFTMHLPEGLHPSDTK